MLIQAWVPVLQRSSQREPKRQARASAAQIEVHTRLLSHRGCIATDYLIALCAEVRGIGRPAISCAELNPPLPPGGVYDGWGMGYSGWGPVRGTMVAGARPMDSARLMAWARASRMCSPAPSA